MLSWFIQITLISIILIFLVHHLIHFFKTTLTVPKIKDLVNTPTQKYENMYNIINNSHNNNNISNNNNNNNNNISDNNFNDLNNSSLENNYTLIELLPKKDDNNMKKDLKNFLKKLQKSNNNNNNNNTLNTLDSLNDDKFLYSNY